MNKGKKTTDKPQGNEEALQSELASLKSSYEECSATLKKVAFELGERRKELRCQNRMSEIFSDLSLGLDEICLQVLDLIPPAWQFPVRTGAMIVLEGKTFRTKGFSDKSPQLQQDINAEGVKAGEVRISLKVPRGKTEAAPFLPEENDLIQSITLRMGNVVALKKREQARRKGEALYHSILSASPDVITITDLEGTIQFSSERAVKMFGAASSTEYLGHPMLEYIDPSDHEKAKNEIGKMLSGQLSGAADYTAVRADGSKFDVEVNGEFLRDENGRPVQMIFVARDISDRKNAERNLSRTEERFKSMVENLNDVVYEVSNDGIVNYVSPSIEGFLGFKPEELVGRNFFGNMHEDDRPGIMQKLGELNKRDYDFLEYRYYNKAGEVRWVRSSTTAMFENEKLIGGRGVLIDITERKKTEHALKESETLYRSLIDSADAAILVLDKEGRYKYINAIGARDLGLPADKILGKRIHDVFPPDVAESIMSNVDFVFSENTGRVVEERIVLGGRERWYRTSTQPVRNESGVPVSALLFASDITGRKEAELLVSQSEQKYRTLFEYSPDGYLIFRDGIFVECNKTSEKLVGGSRADIVGKRPDEISPEYQPNGKRSFDYVIEVVNEAFATGKNEFEWTH
ncbi:MAG: PAS domain S-box protein, partial [Bacteroidota bacterium]